MIKQNETIDSLNRGLFSAVGVVLEASGRELGRGASWVDFV